MINCLERKSSKLNSKINKKLKEIHSKERYNINMLLCGIENSGKSKYTIIKKKQLL
jgi:hypothetical protein